MQGLFLVVYCATFSCINMINSDDLAAIRTSAADCGGVVGYLTTAALQIFWRL